MLGPFALDLEDRVLGRDAADLLFRRVWADALEERGDFRTLLELLRRGEIHPVVAERLPLSDARRAHEMLERSAATG
jgi:NADPH:quinone reductase-like Zn-dependent oxidoreductase